MGAYFQWALFIWLLIVRTISGTNSKLLVQSPQSMASFIDQFQHWDLLFHIDEHFELFHFIEHTHLHNPVTIFRYTHKRNFFIRPRATRCVNLVSYYNSYFWQFSKRLKNINEMDVVIFITAAIDPNANYTTLYGTGVDNANAAFVVDYSRALSIFFYSSQKYRAYVREVSRDKNGIPELYKYQNLFTDFYGFPLTVGYTDCSPFVYKHGTQFWGVENEIMKIVSERLNITPIMTDFSNKFNARNALIVAVNKSDLHFGIGCLGNNIRRNEMVAFSSALKAEPYITVYASSEGRYGPPPLYALFAPLTSTVWMLCGISLLILSFFVKVVLKLHPTIRRGAVLIPTEVLLEQSTFVPRHSNALRLSLFAWILVGLALSTSYKTKLTAALIMPDMKEPTTLKELLDQGYQFISPAMDSTFLIELLQFSSDPIENEIGFSIKDTKDVCEALVSATTEWLAVIEERTVIRFTLWSYCYHNMTTNSLKTIRRLKQDTSLNDHVWAMPKAAPYKMSVSLTLEWMKCHGLVDWWYNSYNLTRTLLTPNQRGQQNTDVRTRLIDLISAWILITFGFIVSTLAFLAEKLFYDGKRKMCMAGWFSSFKIRWPKR